MQNTSHAVMAQRIEPHDSLDDFPTPPWAVRAFVKALGLPGSCSVWEPAANRGFMVKALREHFSEVFATDVHDYGVGFDQFDFLMPSAGGLYRPDWVITNPPFRLAADFVEQGLRVARCGVAVLCRSTWAESAGRYNRLFRDKPPTTIFQYVHRVPMVRGRYDPQASTATGYSWFVWRKSSALETRFVWIPESKAQLYLEGDAKIEKENQA